VLDYKLLYIISSLLGTRWGKSNGF